MVESTILLVLITLLVGAVAWANHGVPPKETSRQRERRHYEDIQNQVKKLEQRIAHLEQQKS